MTSSARALAPLTAGVLDAEIQLKEALSENMLVFFCSVSEVLVNFDQNGIPIEM